jgi:hypothetical protein
VRESSRESRETSREAPREVAREAAREEFRPSSTESFSSQAIPMVAMMLFGPWQSQITPIWQRGLHGMGVDVQEEAQVIQFFRQAHPERDGHSQLFVSFYWLQQFCHEIEHHG